MVASAASMTMTAFLGNKDDPTIRNAIHSTVGAQEYGYRAPLVGGATVFGWATPLILEHVGRSWIDHGWAELAFLRPTFPGDELTISLEPESGQWALTIRGEDGKDRITGDLGLGDAPWLDDVLVRTPYRPAEPSMAVHPRLTLEVAPVGRQLSPVATFVSVNEALEYAETKQRTDDPLFVGEQRRLHPGWIVNRPTAALHHSFDYGPAIHVRSHLQLLAPAEAGQKLTTTATFREAYERKGHHYGAYDCTTYAADGTELIRQRHTTIFQVAKRDS